MIHGKGAQINPANPFLKNEFTTEHDEGIDEYTKESKPATQVFYESPKKVISINSSPDLGHDYSINPYQGCEHGCVYCYARNSHTYWGFSAGLDFESKIIVKPNVARTFEQQIRQRNYRVKPIMLSGNTDCYQPLERKFKLTRSILQVALDYRHPISLITKNVLVLRDLDLVAQLAELDLIHIFFSINSAQEKIRKVMEPRTATAQKKFHAMEILASHNIPVGIMAAPIIPGLNDHEIPNLFKQAAKSRASAAGYSMVRLNGQIGGIFEDWVKKAFPDRAEKITNQIKEVHGGSLKDSEWGRRMTGEGQVSEMIKQLYQASRKKYFGDKSLPELNTKAFRRAGNYQLF